MKLVSGGRTINSLVLLKKVPCTMNRRNWSSLQFDYREVGSGGQTHAHTHRERGGERDCVGYEAFEFN